MTATPEPLVQYDKAALATMSAAEIEKARLAGQLDVMLGRDPAEVALEHRARTEQLSRDDVRRLFAAGAFHLIDEARQEGRITYEEEI